MTRNQESEPYQLPLGGDDDQEFRIGPVVKRDTRWGTDLKPDTRPHRATRGSRLPRQLDLGDTTIGGDEQPLWDWKTRR